ncbi:MAG: hypothetical protein QM820_23710 [Minicystis sp.]
MDIAHYLKHYGCGLFGILVTRLGAGQPGLHAIKEQWIASKKMIVVLKDDDMRAMLDQKARGGEPEEIIRKKVGEFRMHL